MTAPDVAAIARGLTKAQRDALIEPHQWLNPGGKDPIALVDCKTNMPNTLAHAMTMQWDMLTPLGLAVRAHLTQESNR